MSGYALSAATVTQVLSPQGSLPGSATRRSGGHSAGSGAAPGDLGVIALGAGLLLVIAAPWPLAARRRRALATFDHDGPPARSQDEDWIELPPDRDSTGLDG